MERRFERKATISIERKVIDIIELSETDIGNALLGLIMLRLEADEELQVQRLWTDLDSNTYAGLENGASDWQVSTDPGIGAMVDAANFLLHGEVYHIEDNVQVYWIKVNLNAERREDLDFATTDLPVFGAYLMDIKGNQGGDGEAAQIFQVNVTDTYKEGAQVVKIEAWIVDPNAVKRYVIRIEGVRREALDFEDTVQAYPGSRLYTATGEELQVKTVKQAGVTDTYEIDCTLIRSSIQRKGNEDGN